MIDLQTKYGYDIAAALRGPDYSAFSYSDGYISQTEKENAVVLGKAVITARIRMLAGVGGTTGMMRGEHTLTSILYAYGWHTLITQISYPVFELGKSLAGKHYVIHARRALAALKKENADHVEIELLYTLLGDDERKSVSAWNELFPEYEYEENDEGKE